MISHNLIIILFNCVIILVTLGLLFLKLKSEKIANKKKESPHKYNEAKFDAFYHDLDNNQLPNFPAPTPKVVDQYIKKHYSEKASTDENPKIAHNNAIPVEIQIWVDKVYDYHFDDLVPMMGLVHWCQGAKKALYKYKGYEWYTISECDPYSIFD